VEHEARLVPGSVEHMGANGVAFSVYCCGDVSNLQRHTMAHAHTLSDDEFDAVLEAKYLVPHARAHEATTKHADRARKLAEMASQPPNVTDCDNCR
jgi:hypothetical protein